MEKHFILSFWEKFLFEWLGSNFPDALLFQEGFVGTRKAADDEVPSYKPHPSRTKDRVPGRYHYMLSKENWRMHMNKQKGILLIALDLLMKRKRLFF